MRESGFWRGNAFEEKEAASNVVDREFDDLESLLPVEQRLFWPDIMQKVLRPSELQTAAFRSGSLKKHGPNLQVANLSLPSALFGGREEENERFVVEHGNLPQTKGIKPNYLGKPGVYFQSEKRSFFEVEQCCVWEINAFDNIALCHPYLVAYMSECALLLGRSEERLIAAHTSYGEARDVEAAYEYMIERGIAPQSIYAMPSFTETRLYKDNPLYTSAQQYIALGISPEHILSFQPTHETEEPPASESGASHNIGKSIWRNMGEAIITPIEISVYRFDLKTEYGSNYYSGSRTTTSEPQYVKSVAW